MDVRSVWSLALLQTIGNAMKLLRVVFPSLPMFLNNVPYISMSLVKERNCIFIFKFFV